MTATASIKTPCPYCTTPLGDELVHECEDCGAGHHADCWAANGGCAVALCASGPKGSDPALRPPVTERRVLVVELDDESGAGAVPAAPAVATLPAPVPSTAPAMAPAHAEPVTRPRVALVALAGVAAVLFLVLVLVVLFS